MPSTIQDLIRIVNEMIVDGTIDLTKKCTYVPVNKAGDTMTGDLLPDPTDAHDFGSAAKRWRNLHLGGELYSDNTVPGRITIPSSIFGKFTDPPVADVYGITFALEFTVDKDMAYYNFCVPRDWRAGTDMTLALFWTRSTTGSDESGKTVKWEVQYLPINGIDENCNAGESTLSVQDTYDSASTTDQIVYATDGITIPGAALAVHDMVMLRAKAVAPTGTALVEPALLGICMLYTRYQLQPV